MCCTADKDAFQSSKIFLNIATLKDMSWVGRSVGLISGWVGGLASRLGGWLGGLLFVKSLLCVHEIMVSNPAMTFCFQTHVVVVDLLGSSAREFVPWAMLSTVSFAALECDWEHG